MSDNCFRWVIVTNLTVAVIGGLIIGGIYLAGQQQLMSGSSPLRVRHQIETYYPDSTDRQMMRDAILALQNLGNSHREIGQALGGMDESGRRQSLAVVLRELVQSQKELAAAQQLAAENGRYRQVQAVAGAPAQYFDTRTGEIRAVKWFRTGDDPVGLVADVLTTGAFCIQCKSLPQEDYDIQKCHFFAAISIGDLRAVRRSHAGNNAARWIRAVEFSGRVSVSDLAALPLFGPGVARVVAPPEPPGNGSIVRVDNPDGSFESLFARSGSCCLSLGIGRQCQGCGLHARPISAHGALRRARFAMDGLCAHRIGLTRS